jgi:Domain of unknown function (DUF4105)
MHSEVTRHPLATAARWLAVFSASTVAAVLVVAAGIWGTLALAIAGPPEPLLRNALAGTFGVATLAALVALVLGRRRRNALLTHFALFLAVLAWYASLAPSNDRDWQPNVAVLPHATIDGDLVTVHNIRNFAYRSETDYTPAYYDKRFDLAKLEGVDLGAVYWMGPAIAHIFLSFAFADGEHLAISIETRTEKGEGYSTLRGFFRQYEVHYVVADERDVIRLRTNYRKDPPEDVYLYRLPGSASNGRNVFLGYMHRINALRDKPEFYNTLTTNCTTSIWYHSQVNPNHLPLSWKILASGYLPDYLYEMGRLDRNVPFETLKRVAYVNPRAQAADAAADFSRRIRMAN